MRPSTQKYVGAGAAKVNVLTKVGFIMIALTSKDDLPTAVFILFRPSFKVLEEWFHMLKFREAEALYTLPVAPNLHNLIVSVYSQYNLTPPSDFYYPFMKISNRLDVSPNSLNLLSSSTRVESEPTPSDSDLEQDLKTNNGRGPLKSSVRGTEFFSDSSITSRL